MSANRYNAIIGARILSELNDLKRTPEACAREIGYDTVMVLKIINGEASREDILQFVVELGKHYPIDSSDLLIEDDCTHGIRIMSASESEASSRVFNRLNRDGKKTGYYEYRDTAMSKLGMYKPEWIHELRYVTDLDSNNPDVAYNNGHFLHQLTFFIGPVNFYYEIDGRKYCVAMTTGDSCYITPFIKHSFTTRSQNEKSVIIAVTFGGEVRRAQKEMYAIGSRTLGHYKLDITDKRQAIKQLIKQYMQNERLSIENLQDRAQEKKISINIKKIFASDDQISHSDLKNLARLLSIDPTEVTLPHFNTRETVSIKRNNPNDFYWYPNNSLRHYKIFPLVRVARMPHVKSFNIEVHENAKSNSNRTFISALHSYVYIYGTSNVLFQWSFNSKNYKKILKPGSSIYLQPFIQHAFSKYNGHTPYLLAVGIPGSMSSLAQRELSYFPNERIFSEDRTWFD